MKEMKNRAPFYYYQEQTVPSIVWDLLLTLFLCMIMPIINYGPRILIMTLFTGGLCLLAELIGRLLARREIAGADFSPVVTGMLIAMLMPANAPFWLFAAAALFSMFVVRIPFGGTGRTPFHPAAAGISFAAVGWPTIMFSYPAVPLETSLPWFGDCVSTVLGTSPSASLKEGIRPDILPFDMLWGRFSGPMGTTCILVICACACYLFCKKSIDFRAPCCLVATAALYAALFPRIVGSPLTSIKYELMAGSLLFGAVFLLGELSAPLHTWQGKCIYGVLTGLLTMLFREFGRYDQGIYFAILLSDAVVPVLDRMISRRMIKGGRDNEAITQE